MKTACIDGLRTTPGIRGLINWLINPRDHNRVTTDLLQPTVWVVCHCWLQATSSKLQALDTELIVG
jgi:hypothetical protein